MSRGTELQRQVRQELRDEIAKVSIEVSRDLLTKRSAIIEGTICKLYDEGVSDINIRDGAEPLDTILMWHLEDIGLAYWCLSETGDLLDQTDTNPNIAVRLNLTHLSTSGLNVLLKSLLQLRKTYAN